MCTVLGLSLVREICDCVVSTQNWALVTVSRPMLEATVREGLGFSHSVWTETQPY